jgi:hypothetical protein
LLLAGEFEVLLVDDWLSELLFIFSWFGSSLVLWLNFKNLRIIPQNCFQILSFSWFYTNVHNF